MRFWKKQTTDAADAQVEGDFDLVPSLAEVGKNGGLKPWEMFLSIVFSPGNETDRPNREAFLDIYSQMRRRPDGRSKGPLHDIVWQSAALVLGLRPWSEAEYTAVFGQLVRSARHFRMGPSSRNYIEYVRTMQAKEQ